MIFLAGLGTRDNIIGETLSKGDNHMRNKCFIIAVTGLLMCCPLFSLQIKTTSDALYNEEGTFEEDYIFAGSELVFTGSATDLFFVGKKLTFKGRTNSGVYAFGETIVMNGAVGNDFIAGAGKLEIDGRIKGTVFTASGECVILNDSVIDGTLFSASGNITLNGTINGDIYIGAGVFKEIQSVDVPVIELPSSISRRGLTVEQTREYLREVGQR